MTVRAKPRKTRKDKGRPDLKPRSFVYFARTTESGMIKIGVSTNPTGRVADLNAAQHDEVKIIMTIPGDRAKEAAYRHKFRTYRVKGEWFREDGALHEFLKKNGCAGILKKSDNSAGPRTLKSSDHPTNERPDFSKVSAVPRIFGYARVSTVEQSLDMQITALENAGCDRIFKDKLSGKTAQRHDFKLMLKHTQPGDTVLVYALSRLYRNTEQLLALFRDFKTRHITLRSLTENIDITTAHGKMIATTLAAVDEMEAGRVRERTIAGMAERGRQGVKFGAPPKVSPADAVKMKHMRFKTRIPVPAIAAKFKVSAAAVYQHTK